MDGAELTAEIGIPVCASWPRTAGKQLKAVAGVACQNCAGRFGVPLQYSFGADTTRYLFFFPDTTRYLACLVAWMNSWRWVGHTAVTLRSLMRFRVIGPWFDVSFALADAAHRVSTVLACP